MYWRLELANIFLLPVMILFFLFMASQASGWLIWISYLPAALLLLVGGLYWRAKWLQAQGCRAALDALLPWADKCMAPLLWLTIGAAFVWLLALVRLLDGASQGELIASGVFVLLAAAEYVNYYEVQLQHFDHGPDFARLLAGRGFRKSHLKRDLERFARGTR